MQIVPRRFSDLPKVMSSFAVLRRYRLFSYVEKRKYTNVSFKVGERVSRFIPPFATEFEKYFLFVFLRRFGSFDVDCTGFAYCWNTKYCLFIYFFFTVFGSLPYNIFKSSGKNYEIKRLLYELNRTLAALIIFLW